MEENWSDDIGCHVLRIFDIDPREKWPQISNIVLGPGQFLRMPFVGDDKTRTLYLKDGESPITWFLTMRTIRQRIRKVFLKEGVVPSDWMKAKDDRLIKAPGYWKGDKFVFYDAPSGTPFSTVMMERANLRVLFSKGSGKNTLPAITGFKFGMMNVGSATVERQNLTKMAVQRPGIRVKETVIPAGYVSFPELAMR